MINAIFRFLGFHDKKQAQKSQEVAEYVHQKKNEFTAEMLGLTIEAKKAHKHAKMIQKHSEQLVRVTEDITEKIALVTERRRLDAQ